MIAPFFFAMKHKYLKAFIVTIGFIIVGWLSFMQPDWLLMMGILTGACSYALLAVVFTPVGNLTFGEPTNKPSVGKWFAKLCLGQLCLLILTFSATVAFFAAGPNYTLATVDLNDIKQLLYDYSPWQWGPFPWGIIGIWGLSLAYVTYVKQGQPYLYQLGQRIVPKMVEPMLKSYIESTAAGATMLLLSLLVSVVVLLFTYIVDFHFNLFHFAMPIITVILLSFLGPFSSLGMGRKIFRQLSGGRKITLNRIMLTMIVFIIPIMIASAFVGVKLLAHRPDLQAALVCKQCGNYFANVPVESRLAALYWGWWLLWTPLAGSYIAKISNGRTVREFILGLYAVPMLIVIGWGLFQYHPIKLDVPSLDPKWYPEALGMLAFITLALILAIFKANKDTTILLSGFMQPSTSHANRLWLKDPSKVLGIQRFSPKLLMAVIGTLFLHTTAGWFGIQLQVAAMGALVMNAVYIAFNLGVCQRYRDKSSKYT